MFLLEVYPLKYRGVHIYDSYEGCKCNLETFLPHIFVFMVFLIQANDTFEYFKKKDKNKKKRTRTWGCALQFHSACRKNGRLIL